MELILFKVFLGTTFSRLLIDYIFRNSGLWIEFLTYGAFKHGPACNQLKSTNKISLCKWVLVATLLSMILVAENFV